MHTWGATSLKSDVVDEFRSSKDLVHERMARLKAQIGEREDIHDAKAAARRADLAEDYAAEVIAWASDGIDEAEIAVLEAIEARAEADELQGRTAVH